MKCITYAWYVILFIGTLDVTCTDDTSSKDGTNNSTQCNTPILETDGTSNKDKRRKLITPDQNIDLLDSANAVQDLDAISITTPNFDLTLVH